MSTNYFPPPSIDTPTPPWSWSPPVPTWPPPSSSNALSYDDSSSSSSTKTFGIVVGVAVGVLGVMLAFAIWRKYLKKKCDDKC